MNLRHFRPIAPLPRGFRGVVPVVRGVGGAAFFAATLVLFNPCAALRAASAVAAVRATAPSELDLDQLVNLEFTSVGRKEQKLSEVAAAAHLLTQEDIRRSGVTSIPEALRLVPGLDVARVDTHNWAVGSRGFNGVFANKLLVMMDGRSVYTPLFSGVYWDVQDTMLEDIERIEVIAGPGGTLWGANAVNGVINIISKTAKQTQGALVSGGGGTEESAFGGVRYGAALGPQAWFRVYGKHLTRDASVLADGRPANDAASMGRGGLRLDWEPNGQDRVSIQGDYYDGTLRQTTTLPALMPPFTQTISDPVTVRGGNVVARWTRPTSDHGELQIQAYYDYTHRDAGLFAENRRTFDLDAQHRFALGENNDAMWGLGYRRTSDEMPKTSFALSFDPTARTDSLFSGFVQDEIALADRRLRVTLGTKLEHNDYSGFEVQPGLRVLWTPAPRHSLWASAARAVRTASRADAGLRLNTAVIPGTLPTVVAITGSATAGPERLFAYELGYRVQPHERLSLDVSAFYNVYRELSSFRPGMPFFALTPVPPHAVLPLVFVNDLEGETYGGELAARFRLSDWWRGKAGYSFLAMRLHAKPGSGADESGGGENPRHQFQLQSNLDLTYRVQLDLGLRFVDRLPGLSVPSYLELDARLAWRPIDRLELSLVGQNLLHRSHAEFNPAYIYIQNTRVRRGVFAKATLSF